MGKNRGFFYADLEHMNLLWPTYESILLFDELWEKGASLWTIKKEYFPYKTLNELGIHVVDRGSKGKIKKRKNGIWGD